MNIEAIILVAIIFLLGVIAYFLDNNINKKFEDDIRKKFPIKAKYKRAYITYNGELLFSLPSGTLKGYKKWNLKDLGYAEISETILSSGHNSIIQRQFALYDQNNICLKGEYLTPSKKPLKEYSYTRFQVKHPDEYIDFITKHAPHITSRV